MGFRRTLHDLISVYQKPATKADPARSSFEAAPAGATVSTGVFVTRESLMTFPVASGVVLVIWRVLGAVIPSWAEAKPVALVVSFAVGFLVYLISVPENPTKRRLTEIRIIAVLNCFFLTATALGLDVVV